MDAFMEFLDTENIGGSAQLVLLKDNAREFAKAWKDANRNYDRDNLKFIRAQRSIERYLQNFIELVNTGDSAEYRRVMNTRRIFDDISQTTKRGLAELTRVLNFLIRKEKEAWNSRHPNQDRSDSIQYHQAVDALKLLEEKLCPCETQSIPRKPSTPRRTSFGFKSPIEIPKVLAAECVYVAYERAWKQSAIFLSYIGKMVQGEWTFDDPPEDFMDNTGIYTWVIENNIYNFEALWEAWQHKVVSISKQVWELLTMDDRETGITISMKFIITQFKARETVIGTFVDRAPEGVSKALEFIKKAKQM
ncbi:hypothetical protein BC936DRAFT_140954 [Jimgerdemannia flammicorona]|uniref:Uncharacterized protein n=1 Tax=Jimgerdemannia flammicorona TaxID=994334 RepID=A0A433DGH3_9FUNG|nr:hypothetical protein BC936DRAFT_140954 [Jimgerdemannia flammicorona]